MAFLRTIRNTLFGVTSDHTKSGRDNETSAMLGAKLANSSKLTTSANDLPLENDPLAFKFFTYPNDLNTIANGHYIKFDIYENRLAQVKKQPTYEGRFNPKGINATVSDIVSVDTLKQLGRWNDSKSEGDKGSHVAGNNEDAGEYEEGTTFRRDTSAENEARLKRNYLKSKMPDKKSIKNKTPNAVNMDLHSHTHKELSNSSIILYTPADAKFATAMNYENAETGVLSDFIGDSNVFDSISSAIGKIGGGAVVSALEIVVPGAGGFFNRSTGMAVNPNMEVAFKSVQFRTFNLNYKFAPKDTKELDSVHKIIQLFRFHGSPALMGQTSYFAAPSQFVLTYMYRDNQNNYIPKIAKCVLENIEVDYSPGEKFTTLKEDDVGASPQLIDVKLQFKEMSIITKQSISEGY